MRRREDSSSVGVALAAALTAGLVVDWTPHVWRISVAITCISLVAVLWALTARGVRLPWQTIPVALIAAWGFVQLLFGASIVPHMTLESAVSWAMCAISFILGAQILRDRRARHSFLDFMLWASTGLALLAMLQMYTSPGHVLWLFPAEESVTGTFYYRNQFAAFMEIASPIALWQIVREKIALGVVCYAAIFGATLMSTSRAGIFLVTAELIVFLIVMVFHHRLSVKSTSLVAVLAVAMAGAAIIAGAQPALTRFEDPRQYDDARRQLAAATVKMVAERPWMGSGLGTWQAAYPRFATFDLAVIANEAHNDWVQWAEEGGIPFFLLFAILAVWLAKASVQSVWGLGFLAVLVHSYVDYLLREPAIAFLWFAIAGALTQFGQAKSSSATE